LTHVLCGCTVFQNCGGEVRVLAEILTIGDELCRGEIVDTNSSWMAAELWDLGVTVGWMSSCRDLAGDIDRALREALARAPLVFVSGGLGPTEDDLTVDVIAEVAGVTPVIDPGSLERWQERVARASYKVTPNNQRQVRIPQGARALANSAGAAPGFELELLGGRVFVFPGVPRELHAIWEQHVRPRVRELAHGGEQIARRTYRVFGLGESVIDHQLSGLDAGVAGATLHYQVAFPEVLVKLVVRDPGGDGSAATARLSAMDAELRQRLGEHVYSWTGPDGFEKDSMAAALGRALGAARATLAVAESCTGGMLGSLVTDVSGSSAWFAGGWITYTNALKRAQLGVRAETLAAHGAVSRECVEEMALGARARAGTTFAAAISGIAGPDGGTAEKPVGTVHIAVAGPGDRVLHRHQVFPSARDMVRRISAYWAMSMVMRALREAA
jgi:nicotinamide-nucleotide amidase